MADLASLREDSGHAVQRLIRRTASSTDGAALVRDVDELCLHFHTIAAASLLVDGNPQGFFLNLCRAAENWRRMLKFLRQKGLPLPASTRSGPFLGAVAAGHWALAGQVAEASETRWLPDEEYRSEHLWAQLLHVLVAPHAFGAAVAPHRLDALESMEDEASRERAAMARALLERDAPAFAEAFRHAVLVRSEDTEKRAALFTTSVTRFAPYRFLWLEGLALLRLAERAGFGLYDEHFLYCPPLARTPMTDAYRGDWVVSLPPCGTNSTSLVQPS